MWPRGTNVQTVSLKRIHIQVRLGTFDFDKHRPQAGDVELSLDEDGYQSEAFDGHLHLRMPDILPRMVTPEIELTPYRASAMPADGH